MGVDLCLTFAVKVQVLPVIFEVKVQILTTLYGVKVFTLLSSQDADLYLTFDFKV